MPRIPSRAIWLVAAFAAMLTGCGGDGDSPAVPQVETIGPLFLSDGDTGAIAAFPTLTTGSGLAFADHVVASFSAVPSDPPFPAMEPLAYDAVHDLLYVGGNQNRMMAVGVFSGASSLASGASPEHVMSFVADAELNELSIDPATDTLTMAGPAGEPVGPEVVQFAAVANASAASGVIVATPGVQVQAWPFEASVALDPGRDVLYATRPYTSDGSVESPGVAVYEQASSGLAAPARTLLSAVTPACVSVDTARDILYVADPAAGLWIVQHASTATPVVVGPLQMTDATLLASDAASDRLYVVAAQNLYVLAHASGLTSAAIVPAPTVTNSGPISGIAFR